MRKILLTLLCVSCVTAQAADEDITFHGTLLAPPVCTISGGDTISVEFRDPSWAMTLTWTGTQTSYNDAAIETDVPGFGIELQRDGQRFKLNTPLTINANDFTRKPKLEAVPVKATNAVLTDTNFTAYATLRVEYQ